MADDDDDLLAQAQNETANALTPGKCCEPNTVQLRNQIISLLMCDACQDMRFRVGNILFNGYLYRCVANAFREPGHKIHIKIVSDLGDKEATYGNRVFSVKFGGISTRKDQLIGNCETIIHECTHACIDAQLGKRVWRTDNEVAAWFGGVLWLRGQGYPIPGENDFRKTLRDLADNARKANVRREVFTLPDAARDFLTEWIVGAYQISPLLEDVGIGF